MPENLNSRFNKLRKQYSFPFVRSIDMRAMGFSIDELKWLEKHGYIKRRDGIKGTIIQLVMDMPAETL